jgi:drug/metabolite transporter (DMT)-like permease
MYPEPITTFILAWLILSEIPAPIAILGGCCALSGVILVNSS